MHPESRRKSTLSWLPDLQLCIEGSTDYLMPTKSGWVQLLHFGSYLICNLPTYAEHTTHGFGWRSTGANQMKRCTSENHEQRVFFLIQRWGLPVYGNTYKLKAPTHLAVSSWTPFCHAMILVWTQLYQKYIIIPKTNWSYNITKTESCGII